MTCSNFSGTIFQDKVVETLGGICTYSGMKKGGVRSRGRGDHKLLQPKQLVHVTCTKRSGRQDIYVTTSENAVIQHILLTSSSRPVEIAGGEHRTPKDSHFPSLSAKIGRASCRERV